MFFASHPSVYTLPGTWEPQPDVVFDPTYLLASAAVVFATAAIISVISIKQKRKRAQLTYYFIMKEFDYDLDYKSLDFSNAKTRKLYRIGRGEQGVLLVRPYTNDICAHWRFKTPDEAVRSSNKIFAMYLDYRDGKDFIGMDMCRKFLEMGFTRARRYANHNSGRKYKKGTKEILPQEEDHMTSKYAESARIFKKVRDIVAKSETYVTMRKSWRLEE